MQISLISADTIKHYPSLNPAGLSLRTPTRGPEHGLVYEYIKCKLPPAPADHFRTIFIEPRLDAGFPDIVVVYWHGPTADRWMESRAKLTKLDIRLLHYLFIGGSSDFEHLNTFFTKGVASSFKRLYNAGLIKWVSGNWQTQPVHEIFSVRRLIAIEAKVNEWKHGLQQALRNTWFASESYLLISQMPNSPKLLEEAARCGVGVVSCHQFLDNPELSARHEQLPKSYASWLFNEWAWRSKCV
ncbi:hypothetical protein NDA01_29755 [Trichocoleus desertorum AS-A10]